MSSMTYENTQASTSSSSLSVPAMVLTHEPSTSSHPIESTSLGYTFSLSRSSTRESRHDRRLSILDLEADNADGDVELGMAPPAYEEPPVYTKREEPITLAMYLFKFGFLFPPFWILGAFILLSPLRAPEVPSSDDSLPAAWLPEKTEAERQAIIEHMRKAELKWAWRCLWALLIVAFFSIAAGVTIYMVLKSQT
ncbi:hypothetical protein K435DRAFT_767076 [Dendrothele bispora CBS 962.96]|uniref:Transmembrane protein n=1 Tax=Dendrothele bispora (strain CBS 962.96) TaxID=1314807 RepID=A0A4S8L0D2_DENBC|nr:hypothetical protein K435DRAFT_767076 [Dendrothele bispora CBS 962.96]